MLPFQVGIAEKMGNLAGFATVRCASYLRMCMQPWPFVRKNRSLVLFQLISFTSKWNCSSASILCVRASMKVTRSSLLPTAIALPLGDQVMLMFSPLVLMVATHFCTRVSHILTDLSPLAVLSRSGLVWCQHNWSTEPPCPLNVISLFCNWASNEKIGISC